MSKTIRVAFLVFIYFFGVALNAQIHSEAPITFIEGKMYTDSRTTDPIPLILRRG